LNNDDKKSWKKLAEALKASEYKNLANKITIKYIKSTEADCEPPKPGK